MGYDLPLNYTQVSIFGCPVEVCAVLRFLNCSRKYEKNLQVCENPGENFIQFEFGLLPNCNNCSVHKLNREFQTANDRFAIQQETDKRFLPVHTESTSFVAVLQASNVLSLWNLRSPFESPQFCLIWAELFAFPWINTFPWTNKVSRNKYNLLDWMNIFPWTKVVSSNEDNLFIKNNNFFESNTVNWEKQHMSNPDAFKLKKTMNKNWYMLLYSVGYFLLLTSVTLPMSSSSRQLEKGIQDLQCILIFIRIL